MSGPWEVWLRLGFICSVPCVLPWPCTLWQGLCPGVPSSFLLHRAWGCRPDLGLWTVTQQDRTQQKAWEKSVIPGKTLKQGCYSENKWGFEFLNASCPSWMTSWILLRTAVNSPEALSFRQLWVLWAPPTELQNRSKLRFKQSCPFYSTEVLGRTLLSCPVCSLYEKIAEVISCQGQRTSCLNQGAKST